MRLNIKFILLILLLFPGKTFPATPEEIIEKFNQAQSFQTLKGTLNLIYQSGEIYSANFIYMNPGKIYIKFSTPAGKVIVTDGRKLWVYDSTTNVCGVQEVETGTEEVTGNDTDPDSRKKVEKAKLSGGIARILKSYELVSATQEITGYSIIMTNNRLKYSDVRLNVDQNYMLKGISFKDKNGEGFTIQLSNLSTGERVTPGIFNFDVPADAQVVKNPLDVR